MKAVPSMRLLCLVFVSRAGSIPSELGEMEAMEEVDLQNNQFTGEYLQISAGY